MNLVLVQSSEIGADGAVSLGDQRAEHILRVLGKKPGDTVRVGVIDGGIGCRTVTGVQCTTVTLSYCEEEPTPPRQPVDLLLALPRPKVMKRLWTHLATLGVNRIVITGAHRVERYYFDSHALNPGLITSRLEDGLAQAGDTRLPAVQVERTLRGGLARVEEGGSDCARIVLDVGPDLPSLHDHPPMAGRRVLVAIGPEGGWSDGERAYFEERGFAACSLGPRILRVDGACVVALSVAHHLVRCM